MEHFSLIIFIFSETSGSCAKTVSLSEVLLVEVDICVNVDVMAKLLDVICTGLICAAYQAVAEHGESDTLVQDSTSHTSNVHSFYVSQPVNNFDFSAPVSD